MKRHFLAAAALCGLSTASSSAQDASNAFVEANVLGIFYHELGHALIDIEDVPIFGQEEDAADTFSILLIDALFEPDAAEALAYDAALGFWAEAESRDFEGEEVAYWAVHGPDEQRYFNTVCLFYGADPDERAQFAKDLELPEERAEYCPEEFDQALNAWGPVLDMLESRKSGGSFRLVGQDDSLTSLLLVDEIDALNAQFSLAKDLTVTIESCGEPNAFYDPNDKMIIMCSEFEEHLREIEALVR